MLRQFALAAAAIVMLAGAPAYSDTAKPLEGRTTLVLLPPWGTLPKELVDQFHDEIGITAEIQSPGWDDLRTRIVTALIANQAPTDVVEFDWSWVGQFGAAGLFAPLYELVSADLVNDLVPSGIFVYDNAQGDQEPTPEDPGHDGLRHP